MQSERCLGLKSFFPRLDGAGDDGRSLSARIESRFHRLRTLQHPHLCQYLDLLSGHRARLLLVSEHYTTSLQHRREEIVKSDDLLRPFLFQLLHALSFLHSNSIVHRNVDINNIMFDEHNNVKLADFGLFDLTNYGNEVNFIIGHPLYLPPELLFASPTSSQSLTANTKVDVWSVGVVLLLLLRNELPFTDNDPTFIIDQLSLIFQRHARSLVAQQLQRLPNNTIPAPSLAPAWQGLISWPNDLLSHPQKYRAPPEQVAAPAPAVPAFRNPAFWDDEDSGATDDIDIFKGKEKEAKAALAQSERDKERELIWNAMHRQGPACKYCHRPVDAPDYSQADEAQKKSLAAQKLAAALGDDDESNTNAAAAKPNNTTAQSNNRNSKPGTANKSYLMCLECFFDVTNLNLSAPGLSFGRHRLTVSPELSSFLSCCLSLNVHERPTPTQLLAHPYFAPMYSQRNQSLTAATTIQKSVFSGGSDPHAPAEYIRAARLRSHQLPASKLAPVAPLSPPPVTSAATSVPFTLSSISFDELYYLWTKAGGDAQAELVRLGCFEQLPSIESLPILVRSTNDDTAESSAITSVAPTFSFSSSYTAPTEPNQAPDAANPDTPMSAPESAPISARTAALMASARVLRPLFCSPVHVLSSVSVEGVLTETKRNAAMATANQAAFGQVDSKGALSRNPFALGNRNSTAAPLSARSSLIVQALGGGSSVPPSVNGSDSNSPYNISSQDTALLLARYRPLSSTHRYQPNIVPVSSKWLKDLLCADEAQPEIEHDEPAETKGMNNTELFKLTIGRLKKIRRLLQQYPSSRLQLIELTMPLAAAMLSSAGNSLAPSELRTIYAITCASIPPKSAQSLSQARGSLCYGSLSSLSHPDMPCFLRRLLWPIALEIDPDFRSVYASLSTAREVAHEIDHQLDIDIPRCHQYHSLLASSSVHLCFRRILKSFLAHHPQFRYWQGLDSLCAPILALFWPDEALVFAVLSSVTTRYLRGFLCPDNTNTLNLYLATFSSLLAYHDPELATHLDNISFTPEQFAVPWFMTLFAHVLPMDQLYLCLDLLLQAPCSFPLFLATAIMISLRDILLARDSSGCMTYFANVLTIDTQEVLRLALITLECTPASFCSHILSLNDTTVPLSLALAKADSLKLEPVFFRQHNSAQPLTILVPPRLGSLDAMSAPAGKAVTQASPQSVATQKFTVIDIRAPAEYFQAHWPNSIHIPFTTAPPPSHTSGGSAQNYNDIVVLNPSTISANDLQPIVRLANQHYSESNFDALLVVVGSTVNDQNRFCGELIRNGISHVCVFDTQSIASAAASSDEGGWNVLAQIAVELKVTLNTQAPPTH